ncbi:glycosyltransferase family 2 protein [Paenibacillus sp. FSL K6-1566]|uniref:tetratricopeptide repeat-containing glycosyltransferase family 2 protein n=1 Tax=Paenibacillus TaxID=44249 RepID=UPI00203E8015|nr:glycosyltransferase family 2 protein [Paenibacillus lactis]MCM3493470.1 glycosyltransferase family 2 protein [Paenibacillus lactis]
MKFPISVCFLVKNEENFIVEAIQSVSNMVEEIVLMDTGSTDSTIRLALQHNAKVFHFEWMDDFAAARNELIKCATMPYVLMMDADERLNSSEKDIESYIIQNAGSAGRVSLVNIINENENGISSIARIFPNNGSYKYKGKIHEQLTNMNSPMKVIDTQIIIKHLGYQSTVIKQRNKVDRNIRLLKSQLFESGNDPYVLFQLGRTYLLADDYRNSEKYLLKAKEYCNSVKKPAYYSSIIYYTALMYLKNRNWKSCLENLVEGIGLYPDFTDLYFMYGSLLIESRDVSNFALIPEVFNTCIELGEADSTKYETVRGVGSFKAYKNLGLFYEIVGDQVKSSTYYQKSAECLETE